MNMDIKQFLNRLGSPNNDNSAESFKCHVTGVDAKPYRLAGVLVAALCDDENERYQEAFRDSETRAALIDLDNQRRQFPLNNEPTLENQIKLMNISTRIASLSAQLAGEIAEYLNNRRAEYAAESTDVSAQEVGAEI